MKKRTINKIISGLVLICLLCAGILPAYAASEQKSQMQDESGSNQIQAYSDVESVPQEVLQEAVADFGAGFETVMPWILLSLVAISVILVLILLRTKRKFY